MMVHLCDNPKCETRIRSAPEAVTLRDGLLSNTELTACSVPCAVQLLDGIAYARQEREVSQFVGAAAATERR